MCGSVCGISRRSPHASRRSVVLNPRRPEFPLGYRPDSAPPAIGVPPRRATAAEPARCHRGPTAAFFAGPMDRGRAALHGLGDERGQDAPAGVQAGRVKVLGGPDAAMLQTLSDEAETAVLPARSLHAPACSSVGGRSVEPSFHRRNLSVPSRTYGENSAAASSNRFARLAGNRNGLRKTMNSTTRGCAVLFHVSCSWASSRSAPCLLASAAPPTRCGSPRLRDPGRADRDAPARRPGRLVMHQLDDAGRRRPASQHCVAFPPSLRLRRGTMIG
jgi:hypothetical protein